MRILQINMSDNGSTGNIMLNIAKVVRKRDGDAITCSTLTYTRHKHPVKMNIDNHVYYGSHFENKWHCFIALATGRIGYFSTFGTLQLIKLIKNFSPDVIQLHNLHKFCINLPLLFNYIKKHKIATVWTLHDCWSFTGHCPHFTLEKCDKWQNGCYKCSQYRAYPKSLFDNSRFMYKNKRKWFTGVPNMTLVTPSVWLKNLTKMSFLKDYDVRVINNGIDLSVFKPTESDFRQKYGLQNKKIILGVAFDWGIRKGLDVFARLVNDVGENYCIVIVGTTETIEKELPENIIKIRKTHDQIELAEIYTAADVFVNPTREDNYPTVNMEALACGTPVVTFNTGGSPEIIDDTCGSVVACDDYEALKTEIMRVCEEKPYTKDACLTKSLEFDANKKYEEYIDLYKELMSR